MNFSEATATWAGAIAAVIVAIVALFQEKIRRYVYHPTLEVTASTDPPGCVQIPMVQHVLQPGQFAIRTATSYYLRVSVANTGNEAARSVEVYAKALSRRQQDGSWKLVKEFPSMNLVWSNSPPEPNFKDRTYLLLLPPKTTKHCDVGHIIDPKMRGAFEEENARLRLKPDEMSLTFDVIAKPNHQGHIVRPGTYRLDIVIAAENAKTLERRVEITLHGSWHDDEATMLSSGVGIRVLDTEGGPLFFTSEV